MDILERK